MSMSTAFNTTVIFWWKLVVFVIVLIAISKDFFRHDSGQEVAVCLGFVSKTTTVISTRRNSKISTTLSSQHISSLSPPLTRLFRRRLVRNYYEDDDGLSYYEEDIDDKDERSSMYYDDEVSDDDYINQSKDSGGGYYRVYFNEEVDPSETQLDWEVCSDGETEALVLLPPAAIEKPRAILHFVGGTFFGSAPKIWYRTLLESIVRHTQTAIIVTPIPVRLFKSPLQHIQLTRKLQRAFQNAWYTVLEDEYGEDILEGIPLCGMGHSLGARLLTVLTTVNQNKPIGKRIPPYKSFCLISFTNYGASAGIPGVGTLLKQSRKQEREIQVNGERQRYKRARDARNDWWLDDNEDEPYGYDNDDMNMDNEWSEIVEDLQAIVKEQASRVKTALTPKSKDLEFFPSPAQLWKAIQNDGRYSVNETLLVQFDNDPVDQSSKLAQILHDTNSSNVKFARLRGTHLIPVTVIDGTRRESAVFGYGSLLKAIRGRTKTKEQEVAMQELRQSIVAYIKDVATK